jgi:hypothetical protein
MVWVFSRNCFADGPLPMMRISLSCFLGMLGVGLDFMAIFPRESKLEIGIALNIDREIKD